MLSITTDYEEVEMEIADGKRSQQLFQKFNSLGSDEKNKICKLIITNKLTNTINKLYEAFARRDEFDHEITYYLIKHATQQADQYLTIGNSGYWSNCPTTTLYKCLLIDSRLKYIGFHIGIVNRLTDEQLETVYKIADSELYWKTYNKVSSVNFINSRTNEQLQQIVNERILRPFNNCSTAQELQMFIKEYELELTTQARLTLLMNVKWEINFNTRWVSQTFVVENLIARQWKYFRAQNKIVPFLKFLKTKFPEANALIFLIAVVENNWSTATDILEKSNYACSDYLTDLIVTRNPFFAKKLDSDFYWEIKSIIDEIDFSSKFKQHVYPQMRKRLLEDSIETKSRIVDFIKNYKLDSNLT